MALWAALLLLSVVISACLKILSNTEGPLCFGILAGGYLCIEFLLSLLVFTEGQSFLPSLLVLTSSISTAVLALISVAYIGYVAAGTVGSQPRDGMVIGYGYLWG